MQTILYRVHICRTEAAQLYVGFFSSIASQGTLAYPGHLLHLGVGVDFQELQG